MNGQDQFYAQLKGRLKVTTKFPSYYLYKFIVPAKGEGLAQVKKVFEKIENKMDIKFSKTRKYISVSVKVWEENENQVIARYKSVSHIQGIISL